MDLNKVYKTLYLYHEEGYSNYKKIASMTKLYYPIVEQIIEGKLFTDVLEQYKQDEAIGDFSRTYPTPYPVKLNEEQYEALKHQYLDDILCKKISLDDVICDLIIKGIQPKQAQQMVQELSHFVNMSDAYIKSRLDNILKVLEMPEKWSVNKHGNIITVYPYPVLNEKYNVKKIEYKPTKGFEMPKILAKRIPKHKIKNMNINIV